MSDLAKKLLEPFPESDIEWRVQRAMRTKNGDKAIVVPYVQNRAIMNRLDAVFGIDCWKNEYKELHQGVICGISIKIENEWITKWDGADLTNIEATKGGMSNSMKRAAVQWGIGRYLYNLEEVWVDVKKSGQNYVNSKVKSNGKEEWMSGYWDNPRLPDWALPSNEQDNLKQMIETKWKTLAGNMDGFDKFHSEQKEKGLSDNEINIFLTRKLNEKKGA